MLGTIRGHHEISVVALENHDVVSNRCEDDKLYKCLQSFQLNLCIGTYPYRPVTCKGHGLSIYIHYTIYAGFTKFRNDILYMYVFTISLYKCLVKDKMKIYGYWTLMIKTQRMYLHRMASMLRV